MNTNQNNKYFVTIQFLQVRSSIMDVILNEEYFWESQLEMGEKEIELPLLLAILLSDYRFSSLSVQI